MREPSVEVQVSGRRVTGEFFASESELAAAYAAAAPETRIIRIVQG
jgi:hypothetical protein